MAARSGLLVHLEAIASFIVALPQEWPERNDVAERIWSTAVRWAEVENGEAVSVALAAESCEVVVTVLRFLRGELGLTPSTACLPYTGAFLVLARTMRAFEDADGLPAPGQRVLLHSLLSEAGMQLNGTVGTMMRFDAVSGRFCVQLQEGDPPTAWKKVKAQNLAPQEDAENQIVPARSAAREHGRACLEAVAEIFDDLLQEMMIEAEDDEDNGWNKPGHANCWGEAELAAAMWEALVCCVGDDGKVGDMLDLCGGSASLCSMLARHVFAAHLGYMRLAGCEGDQAKGMVRLRVLQESLARSYCDMFRPAALWQVDETGFGEARNDVPMTNLQAEFHDHVRSLADTAVSFGVIPMFVAAVDFHLAWLDAGATADAVPIVLPVLLSRLLCTLLAPAAAPSLALCRHVQLNAGSMLEVLAFFAVVVSAKFAAAAGGVVVDQTALVLALRAALDAVVVLTASGLWDLGVDVTSKVEALVCTVLDDHNLAADSGVLARLLMVFLGQQQSEMSVRVCAATSSLDDEQRATLWYHVRSRAKLRGMAPADAGPCVQELLTRDFSAQPAVEDVNAGLLADDAAFEQNVQLEMNELNRLIDQCLVDLPQSLRATQAVLPQVLERWGTDPGSTAIDAQNGELLGQPDSEPITPPSPSHANLSLLDMPSLPGQQPRSSRAASQHRRRVKKVTRADMERIRGVDPALAPQELRCAIDGKVLGAPLRSPYGHLFERGTLERWIGMCGSVCPLTGQPLRLDMCSEDHATERAVLEWTRSTKAAYKRQVEARREQRKAQRLAGEGLEFGAVV